MREIKECRSVWFLNKRSILFLCLVSFCVGISGCSCQKEKEKAPEQEIWRKSEVKDKEKKSDNSSSDRQEGEQVDTAEEIDRENGEVKNANTAENSSVEDDGAEDDMGTEGVAEDPIKQRENDLNKAKGELERARKEKSKGDTEDAYISAGNALSTLTVLGGEDSESEEVRTLTLETIEVMKGAAADLEDKGDLDGRKALYIE